jgi:hypothetical protein
MAGAIPPCPRKKDPGGWVRNSILIAEIQFFTTSNRILPKGIRAEITQIIAKADIILSINFFFEDCLDMIS